MLLGHILPRDRRDNQHRLQHLLRLFRLEEHLGQHLPHSEQLVGPIVRGMALQAGQPVTKHCFTGNACQSGVPRRPAPLSRPGWPHRWQPRLDHWCDGFHLTARQRSGRSYSMRLLPPSRLRHHLAAHRRHRLGIHHHLDWARNENCFGTGIQVAALTMASMMGGQW